MEVKLALIAVFAPLISLFSIGAFFNRFRRISSFVSISACGISLVISWYIFLTHLHPFGPIIYYHPWISISSVNLKFGVLLDPLSVMMMTVVTTVSFWVHVYSLGYMEGDPGFSRYYAWLSLFTWAMMLLVVAPNLLQCFLGWELVGASSFLLIGFWYHKPEAAAAAKKAFVVTRFADYGFYFAVIALLLHFGNIDFPFLNSVPVKGLASQGFITICALGLFMGAMGKSAQFPFHVWLPDAMEGPTPVSALIHAATMVAAGVYLVARSYGFFMGSPVAMEFVAIIGTITAFIACWIAVVQDDIKKVLAYSTISQLGYMMASLGAGGYMQGFFHLYTHAFFKSLLFLCAGSLIHHFETNDMWEMAGRGVRDMKITMTTFVIGGLALSGIFPFSGFFSKDAILIAVKEHHPVLFFFLAFGSFLTAYYTFRMLFVLLSPNKEDYESHGFHDSPYVMTVPLMVLAALTCFVGFYDTPLFGNFIGTYLLGEHAHHAMHIKPMVISLAIALSGIGLAYLHFGRRSAPMRSFVDPIGPLRAFLVRKLYMDDLYHGVINCILEPVAWACNWFDRKVINDTGVNGVANSVKFSGSKLSLIQSGSLNRYITIIAVGLMVVVGIWILI